ncbi:MAG: hypothetical protein AAB547_03435 [Patescibacteria group bacterium]
MSEKMSPLEQKGDGVEEVVPAYVLDSALQKANFLIPGDRDIRAELRKKLESYTHYGVMFLPENAKARSVLLANIAAIDAYDAELLKFAK